MLMYADINVSDYAKIILNIIALNDDNKTMLESHEKFLARKIFF